MPRKKRQRISLIDQEDFVVLDMGEVEIWDGADLALLRETLAKLLNEQRCASIAVDMSYVKYVPSGFFGMLLDCYDRGILVTLLRPTQQVAGMLWFQRFFDLIKMDEYRLHSGPAEKVPLDQPLPWMKAEEQETWNANESSVSMSYPVENS